MFSGDVIRVVPSYLSQRVHTKHSVNETRGYLKFAVTYVSSFLPAKLINKVLATHITIILHTYYRTPSILILARTQSLL